MFLIRDWSYPYDASYGFEGGKQLLDEKLRIDDKTHEELRMLRMQIRNCFFPIECFLMPHPGFEVSTNPSFDGRISGERGEHLALRSRMVELIEIFRFRFQTSTQNSSFS